MTSYKIIFYVPASHLEIVKSAVFDAGAGSQGNYGQCCWQVLGEGQFRPLAGSTPFLGEQDGVESVQEYRVEFLCDEAFLASAVAALISAHPYEEPAYDVILRHQCSP
ncbi:MAG: hypothetical protein ACI9D5_002876 [Candidatus Endobugula sp.]|jgi:hypothetical protein